MDRPGHPPARRRRRAAGLPYGATRWLAASTFAIGLPLAGWLNAHLGEAGLPRRVVALVFWLAVVATPPLLSARYAYTEAPTGAPASRAVGVGEEVLRLEAGAHVPLRVDLDSPILNIPPRAGLEMTLNQPVEVALRDGKPDGRYRIGGGAWREIHDGVLRLSIDRIAPRLDGDGPEVRVHADFAGAEFKGDTP